MGASLNVETQKGEYPIHLAARSNNPNLIVIFCLKHNVNPDKKDRFFCSPLHYAVGSNSMEAAECLITIGASLDAVDSKNMTPLHLAIASDRPRFFKKLLISGANTELKTNGLSYVDFATKFGYKHYVEVLNYEKGFGPICALPMRKIDSSDTNVKIFFILYITLLVIDWNIEG